MKLIENERINENILNKLNEADNYDDAAFGDNTKTKKGENKNMTIKQVLRKNEYVFIYKDSFEVFTGADGRFLVRMNGEVHLRTDAFGNYKSTLQTTSKITNKMPSDIPEFLKTSWSFSQRISDDEAMQLAAFLTGVSDALR